MCLLFATCTEHPIHNPFTMMIGCMRMLVVLVNVLGMCLSASNYGGCNCQIDLQNQYRRGCVCIHNPFDHARSCELSSIEINIFQHVLIKSIYDEALIKQPSEIGGGC